MYNQDRSFVAIIGLAIILLFITIYNSDLAEKRGDFITQQYNFSDDECVTVDRATSMEACVSDFPRDIRWCRDHCIAYCRNLTIPDGEECKDVEREIREAIKTCDATGIDESNKTYDISVSFNVNSLPFFPVYNCQLGERTKFITKTVCMPRIRIVGQQCATADTVKESRELIK